MAPAPSLSTTVRGIPLWLLRQYLQSLGGEPSADGTSLDGDGWTARLTHVDDYRVGSLSVRRVRLELDGSPEALARLEPALQRKLLRAGG